MSTNGMSMNRLLKKWAKSRVEKLFGVTITRGVPYVQNQKSDAAVRALRTWSSDDVVFDVGANDGRTVLRIVDQLCCPRIYAFEPVSATYRTLLERTAHLKNVRCYQLALGANPGHQTIYVHAIPAMSSFLPSWLNSPRTAKTETVQVKTVDQVMAEQNVNFIHFLKIDTEGYEMEVLHGARRALAESRVALLQVEVGFGQSAKDFATLEQVRRHLAPLGYRLYGIYTQARAPARCPPQWPATEAAALRAEVLVYCDALFLRADLQEQAS